jgi:hypothetical protein
MRDAVMGVLIGAGAVILASWYLTRTRGQLLPGLSDTMIANGSGCGCQPANTLNQGYQAAPVRAAGQAPNLLGGNFQ